jgi:hypothetical protein
MEDERERGVDVSAWHVRGSYFEGCNCEPVCPCRSIGGRPGGKSSYGVCFGAVSWLISDGSFGDLDLSGLAAVLSLRYHDDVEPSTPWEAVLYVDDQADQAQRSALSDIFLGRVGGTPLAQYARAIGELHAVRPAHITLEHRARRRRIGVQGYINVEAEEAVDPGESVACGIPGIDRHGTEMRNEIARSDDPALRWEVRGGASFAVDFSYSSED